jgi:hypothetical protein
MANTRGNRCNGLPAAQITASVEFLGTETASGSTYFPTTTRNGFSPRYVKRGHGLAEPEPIWRCEFCLVWKRRNGESEARCPYCVAKVVPNVQVGVQMWPAYRVAPEPIKGAWADE